MIFVTCQTFTVILAAICSWLERKNMLPAKTGEAEVKISNLWLDLRVGIHSNSEYLLHPLTLKIKSFYFCTSTKRKFTVS